MKKKYGFTLVELLAVIIILSILIVIVAPSVIKLAGNTKISLYDSKVKTLESAGEKFGNLNINDYKDCKNDFGASYLNKNCTVSIRELVSGGFVTPDDDLNNIINPETNEPMEGNILLCFNPKDVSVYASYLNNSETPQCKDINVQTGASLALSASEGVGYNGGKDIEVTILKTGKVTTSCKSSNPTFVSCHIEGSLMKLKINKDPAFTIGTQTVNIDVTGEHSAGTLSQVYKLTVYPTSLSITDSEPELCMESGTVKEYPIQGENIGPITFESDEEMLRGTLKENKSLILNAGQKTGLNTLKMKEGNGNAEVSITKNIYKLKLDKEVPSELLLGNKVKFDLDYGGNTNANITVTSLEGDPSIRLYKSDENKLTDTLTLEGTDDTFFLKAVKTGKIKLTITGSNCGVLEYEISVANLYVEENETVLYLGGNAFETKIMGNQSDTFSCTSSDTSAVTCEISGSTLKLIPGTKETENATVRVSGSNGGFDTVTVQVRSTSLSLVDSSGTPITKVCSNMDTGTNEDIVINAIHGGAISIDEIGDPLLATATISNNKVIPTNHKLTEDISFSSPYRLGLNTGRTNVKIKESNGNKTASFDYYIYKMNMASNRLDFDITNNTTEELSVITSTTGEISAISSHPEIASVTVTNPTYSYDVNKENMSKIIVTAHTIGETNITIRGKECGELVITVNVIGQKFSIELRPGIYTTSVDGTKEGENSRELSCTTENSDTSCQVTLPNFTKGKNADEIIGYSDKEDPTKINSSDKIYNIGDTITLSMATNGKILYAQSGDTIAPSCIFLENMSTVSYGKEEFFTLSCNETGSGSDSVLTTSSFTISNPEVAEVTSVGTPTEIVDATFGRAGYTYRVGIKGKSLVGEFDISLKPNTVVDKFGNGNEEHKKENVFSAEYKGYKRWYIGKENETDVVAILYVNIDMPEEIKGTDPDDTYTLILYGSGDTKSYNTASITTEIPWIREGYQEFITNVIVKDGITSIGDNLFQSLYNMTRTTLPDSIHTIGESSFNNDQSLKEMIMPASLKTIKANAFENCKNLEKVSLNEGLTTIEDAAFLNHGIKELFIPKTVTSIGTSAFQSDTDNMKLEKLTFEQGINLRTINRAAFRNHKLKSLTIPNTVKFIAHYAFAQSSVTQSSLTDLNFEENSTLTILYDYAFDLCNLSHLELPASLEQIGTNVFSFLGDEITKVQIGPNVKNVGNGFAKGFRIKEFEVDPANSYLATDDGVLYTKDFKRLIKFPDYYYSSHTEYNVKEGTEEIQPWSFGGWLFYEDKKDFILNIPSSVTEINSIQNFLGSIVSKINVSADNSKYADIAGILYDKTLETALVLPMMYPQNEYTVNDTTKTIDTYFGYGNITVKNITIPSSVTKIDNYAFYTDPNLGFTNIYLDTDDSVIIGNGAFSHTPMLNSPSYHRNIYVKTDSLKNRLASVYALEDITIERRE